MVIEPSFPLEEVLFTILLVRLFFFSKKLGVLA